MNRTRDLQADGWTGDAIRTSLAALVLVLLVPSLLFAGWYANSLAAAERRQIEDTARQSVDSMTAALDRHVVSTQNMLMALASSPSLQAGDIPAFYHQAADVARSLNANIVLRDLQRGTSLIHTATPFGGRGILGIPLAVAKAEHQVLASGKPAVSGVIFGRRLKTHIVVIMVR